MAADGDWDFFDKDGAVFRRPKDDIGGVTHVHTPNGWEPYKGDDRIAPIFFGDRCEDPEAGRSECSAKPSVPEEDTGSTPPAV